MLPPRPIPAPTYAALATLRLCSMSVDPTAAVVLRAVLTRSWLCELRDVARQDQRAMVCVSVSPR
jgi:hypothetical protein